MLGDFLFYDAVASAAPNEPRTEIYVAYYIKRRLRGTWGGKKVECQLN